ncbi:VOC family protein [Terrarubrum flagellatum]|uniref:VOC family protein n=1 Tax=Terrirubrum flagellatum TaxID=2895980 RepID=UPI00314515A6
MAHKSRLACLVIDCKTTDLDEAIRFWGGALGYPVYRSEDDPRYAIIETPTDQPKMLLQAVDHDSRIHLDIETDDKGAEVARLEALGARIVARMSRWIVMEAPTGHRFCVVNPQRPDFAARAHEWSE